MSHFLKIPPCQCFCSSCGPEPTTRGQQDSSNDVSAQLQSPHLQEACLKSLSMWQGRAEQMGFLNTSETSIISSWRWCALVSGPPESPLRKLKQILHTHTHAPPSQTHTPFSCQKEKKNLQTCKWIMSPLTFSAFQNWSTVCEYIMSLGVLYWTSHRNNSAFT